MKAAIGTVIHATMRPQDLLPAFLGVLRDVTGAGPEYMQVTQALPAHPFEDDDAEWWTTTAPDIVDELVDLLGEHAPEYCYFGAHPGDGSDYGYWPDFEVMDMDIHDGALKKVDDIPDADGTYILINDHGNMTLGAVYNGVWHEIWAIV